MPPWRSIVIASAEGVTDALEHHPLVTIRREEIPRIPEHVAPALPVIVATGPLTSDELSADISAVVGHDQLYFYDAISPIVLADSIDSVESISRLALGGWHRGGLSQLPAG